MRSFMLMTVLCAGVIGWSAAASRGAQEEQPAAGKETPTTKESPSTKPAEKSAEPSAGRSTDTDDAAAAASSTEEPAAKPEAK